MTTAAPLQTFSVMTLLREGTSDLHTRAETHDFQKSLVSGRISREAYAAYLQQMLLVHRALESALRAAQDRVPAIARVVTAEQFQEPYLLEDLAFYDAPTTGYAPTPGTAALIERIQRDAQQQPLALLGHHYVLEGSNNGNRFIARAIRKAFGLTGDAGVRYLDPYGERQRDVWSAFKTEMDAQGFTEPDGAILLDAAKAMFQGITAISEDLSRAHA